MTRTATGLSPSSVTAPADWPTLRALSADVAQQVFRCCLRALSRPGVPVRLPPSGVPDPVPAVIVPMLALSDLMTPVAGLDSVEVPGAREAAGLVGGVTGARLCEPRDARFAVAFAESEQVVDLSVGSAWSPEFGTLLCQRATSVGIGMASPSNGSSVLQLRLSGPGIKTDGELAVRGLSSRFVQWRAGLNAEFPAGVDVLLITDDGQIAGLPRTTRVEVL